MRLFGGERMKGIMRRIGMQPGEPIDHPMLNKSIEKAQQKVETRNFEIRKHLLDYDDVLNEQRSVIYGQRDAILSDENLAERVLNNAKDLVTDLLEEYSKNHRDPNAETEIITKFRDIFGIQIVKEDLTEEKLFSLLQNDITEKETLAGKENLNMFIRYQYIQVIDKKWLDQLETLDSLREAVSLRTYSQKNPLTEYKNEGFNVFYDMMDTIRTTIISRLFKVRVQLSPEAQEQRLRAQQQMRQMNAQHDESQNGFAGVRSGINGDQARRQAASGAMQKHTQSETATVKRLVPKVGRNDPCPCGSGKKYKQCHGR